MRATISLTLAVLLLASCDQSKFDKSDVDLPEQAGPTMPDWGTENVQCRVNEDCAELETCIEGQCRLKGCTERSAAAAAPLGQQRYVTLKRELVVSSASNLYGMGGGNTTSLNTSATWNLTREVRDVAGGNLLGSRPEVAAVISYDSKAVTIVGPAYRSSFNLAFTPISIAAGDVDADGLDDIVALGSTGQVALCNAKSATCKDADFTRNSWQALDVGMGDVDGDGLAEPTFLTMIGSDRRVVIWNVEHTNEPVTLSLNPLNGAETAELERIAVGDVDGDSRAEIIATHHSGLWKDHLYVFALGSDALSKVYDLDIDSNVEDVAADDIDGDGRAEVGVLVTGDTAWILETAGAAEDLAVKRKLLLNGLTMSYSHRLSLLDVNGDSPLGRLIDGPKLVDGEVIPVAVLTFPPFSRSFSEGVGSVNLGASKNVSEGTSTTVNVNHGINVGGSFGLGPIFKVSVGGGVSFGSSVTRSLSESVSVGNSFSFGSRIELYGSEYAGVVVECGCFAAYTYEIDDPFNQVGSTTGENIHKGLFTILSPVGGQTTLWSSGRYNAMAKALGYLPQIKVPFKIGDPTSYPGNMITMEGQAVNPADLLFPYPPTFRISDVGQIGWSMSAGESETNSSSSSFGVSGSVGVSFWKVNVGYNHSRSWSTGQSITVGKNVSFGGNVPSIPDKPETPEDEYAVNGYAFTPYVYKATYGADDPEGRTGAYYVLMYMVRK